MTSAKREMEPGKGVRDKEGGADCNFNWRWWPLGEDFVNAFQPKTTRNTGQLTSWVTQHEGVRKDL